MPSIKLKELRTVVGASTVSVLRPSGAPAYWSTRMKVDHTAQTVSFDTVGVAATFRCDAGVDNYTIMPGSAGVDYVLDINGSREGQRIWFLDPTPSSDSHAYEVVLTGYSGDARTLTLGTVFIGSAPGLGNVVEYVEVTLFEAGLPVAPVVNGVYSYAVRFVPI